MTTNRGRCPPAPPAGFKSALDTSAMDAEKEPWVRLFWNDQDPLEFKISPRGNRFDPLGSPWEKTRVLYAGTSLETAIAETVLRWHSMLVPGKRVTVSEAGQLRDRRVARFKPIRKLNLIDATGLGMSAVEKAVTEVIALPEHTQWQTPPKPVADDIFQCHADEYLQTQEWGGWFRSQHPDADGLTWVSRQFNMSQCLVLFEDRCGKDLRLIGKPVPLSKVGSSERQVLDHMFQRLGWGIEP